MNIQLTQPDQIGAAQRRIVDILKQKSPCSTAELARSLGVTKAAIRLQLSELQESGLISQQISNTSGRGRPAAKWSLCDRALALFPDRHGELTLELIRSIRESLGEEALDKVLSERDKNQLNRLKSLISENAPMKQKVNKLAQERTRLGYMAEVISDGNDLVLKEHHCPICVAAKECQRLCKNELALFRDFLGIDVLVEREQHLLKGNARCVYRIKSKTNKVS